MVATPQHERQYVLADGSRVPVEVGRWCGPHGEPLNLEPCTTSLDPAGFDGGPQSLWRYRSALPFAPGSPWPERSSMGEGLTPLVAVGFGGRTIHAKLEYLMPTLSFKDRGAAVIVAKAAELGAERIVADSSGNAGTAIAAYAARVGITCEIYVPGAASAAKTAQIESHGAAIVRVDGSREDTAEAAVERVMRGDVFYASHVYNPFFLEGTKTYAFEIWEQLGVPDVVVVPVGNGTMLLGVLQGFDELARAGLIDRQPRVVAVQAAGCSPIETAFREGTAVKPVTSSATIAEGIAIAAPARGTQIVAAMTAVNGMVMAVTDEAVVDARGALSHQGIYAEWTAAASWAAIADLGSEGLAEISGTSAPVVVAPVCGAGLKSAGH